MSPKRNNPQKARRFIAGKPKGRKPGFAHTQSAGRGASNDALWLKALAVFAGIFLVIVIGAIHACVNDAKKAQAPRHRATPRENAVPQPAEKRAKPPPKRRAPLRAPAENTVRSLPAEAPTEAAAQVPAPPEAEPRTADGAPTAAKKQAKARKVVFTDDTRIRTRSDGTVEVPRTFSYAGAGLKRPFWIYDPQLEKSGRIEHEARAEKIARDKWRALYDEASRQDAAAASLESSP